MDAKQNKRILLLGGLGLAMSLAQFANEAKVAPVLDVKPTQPATYPKKAKKGRRRS